MGHLPDQLGFLVIALGCSIGLFFAAQLDCLDLACPTGAESSEVEHMHPPMASLHAVGLVSASKDGRSFGKRPTRLGRLPSGLLGAELGNFCGASAAWATSAAWSLAPLVVEK